MMPLLYFWLGREAAQAAAEQATREQQAREAFTVDHTDAQADE
jgi:hypothetical protein